VVQDCSNPVLLRTRSKLWEKDLRGLDATYREFGQEDSGLSERGKFPSASKDEFPNSRDVSPKLKNWGGTT